MILSADELQVLEYLKTWSEKYVTMTEICRRAGGRRKYEESSTWATGLMTRLVEANLIEVDDRGHYRFIVKESACLPTARDAQPLTDSTVVDDNYFPSQAQVGEDYFPAADGEDTESKRWISPEVDKEVKRSRRKKSKRQVS
jgi:hypothetical protein